MIIRLKESDLYKVLLKQEDSDKIIPVIDKIVEFVSPLLQKIPENMPEFTLHDPNHSMKIIEIMGKIMPEKVLNNLNSLELSLLILSAFLHDIGMTCDRVEKEKIIDSDSEFKILFKSNTEKYHKYEQYISEKNHRAATFIQDQIFTDFLRRNHVRRSAKFISDNLVNGKYELTYNDIPFYKLLIKVCNAHGEPVKSLYDTSIWPTETLVGNNIINIQYLSLILRIADILDLDAERTPKVIYEFVNPENPISILEWKKHRSIIGSSINDKKILFEAECNSPEVERALKEFIEWIEIERKETMTLLEKYTLEESEKYFLTLDEQITSSRIYSDGSYIYNDLMFSLDYQRIMSLLMGQKLYKDSTTALREILQNSIDAIKVRQKIYETKPEKISPTIILELSSNILSIEDNGIGMNMQIFKDYFLQIGKSYYSSQNFYSQFNNLDVTSEFGIGILSAFMIANSIIIDSRREPDNPLEPYSPIHFEIPAAQSYLIQKQGEKKEVGTKIILNLKDKNPFKSALELKQIIEILLPDSPFPIRIIQNNEIYVHHKKLNLEIKQLDHNINETDFFIKNRIDDFEWKKSYTHSIFSINFEDDPDFQLQNIKGELFIVNSNPLNYYSIFNGFLSQRSFAVGFPATLDNQFTIKATESIHSLFPKWFSYYSSLNFTQSACLSITPDRSDFTIDEKYQLLQDKIENKIINSWNNYLEDFKINNKLTDINKFIDFLYVSGFFGFDLNEKRTKKPLSNKSEYFFQKWITFPTLSNDGKIIRTPLGSIINSNNIAVIKNKISENDIPALTNFKCNNDVELILLGNFYFHSHRNEELFITLFNSKSFFLSPMKIFLRPLSSVPIYLYRHQSQQIEKNINYHNAINITNSENINDSGEVVFSTQNYVSFPIFNISHPLINFVFEDLDILNDEKKHLEEKLVNEIYKIIRDSLDILKNSQNIELVQSSHSEYSHIALQGILIKDPTLLDKLILFFENFIIEAKKLGVVDILKEHKKLTKYNLPWYWS